MATFTLVVVGVWFCEVLLRCERYECQLGIWIERDIYEITHTCLKIKLNCIMTKLAISRPIQCVRTCVRLSEV